MTTETIRRLHSIDVTLRDLKRRAKRARRARRNPLDRRERGERMLRDQIERAGFGQRIEWISSALGIPARLGRDGLEVLKDDHWIPLALLD